MQDEILAKELLTVAAAKQEVVVAERARGETDKGAKSGTGYGFTAGNVVFVGGVPAGFRRRLSYEL